jgi:hypothetical protein
MNIKTRLANFNPYNKTVFLIVCCMAPFYFGLISIMLGADTNWDLRNYHLYNPFAFLNNKMNIDLAPAGLQSYFNPVLDVPYYLMTLYFPAPLVGFIMGTVHGLNFPLLAGIAYKALPRLPTEDRIRIPLLLAVFGSLTANFLSGVGNTMGDNVTSLFILASLLIVVANWERVCETGRKAVFIAIVAGLVAGIGAGLKLTNIVYASALCLSFFVVPGNWSARLRLSFFFGVGVLVGVAVTGGHWFYIMWATYGNPLYPQFGQYFPNELVNSGAVHDRSWLPKSLTETLLWPFIFSIDASRVGELFTRQIIWAVAYVIFSMWAGTTLIRMRSKEFRTDLPASAQFIVVTVAIGYVIWMQLFSIQRYLVPLEMCLPLALFILMGQLMRYRDARALTLAILAGSTAVTMCSGLETWGHANWSRKMFRVDLPRLVAPEKTTVILVGDIPVFGWMVTQFPNTIAFVSAGNSLAGIANRSAYIKKIHNMVDKRSGPVFAIIPSVQKTGIEHVLAAEKQLLSYGYAVDANSCAEHAAFIGEENYPYQWCAVIQR